MDGAGRNRITLHYWDSGDSRSPQDELSLGGCG